jgi:hypothetical protein
MPHNVRVKIDTALVANKDFEIFVTGDGGKLGTLLISKGNVEWLPKGNYVNKRRLSWAKFADLMDSQGKRVKKKKKARRVTKTPPAT